MLEFNDRLMTTQTKSRPVSEAVIGSFKPVQVEKKFGILRETRLENLSMPNPLGGTFSPQVPDITHNDDLLVISHIRNGETRPTADIYMIKTDQGKIIAIPVDQSTLTSAVKEAIKREVTGVGLEAYETISTIPVLQLGDDMETRYHGTTFQSIVQSVDGVVKPGTDHFKVAIATKARLEKLK